MSLISSEPRYTTTYREEIILKKMRRIQQAKLNQLRGLSTNLKKNEKRIVLSILTIELLCYAVAEWSEKNFVD